MEIKIPFRKEFEDDMNLGIKTVTSRTKRYGVAGDTFKAFGSKFLIKYVVKLPLWMVAQYLHRAEGFMSSDGFIFCWKQIYPREGYDPTQVVYVHFFMRLKK